MIVWLASYPRSGNTYMRMLLRHGLGLATCSLHAEGDDRDFGRQEGLAEVIGHVVGLGGQALIDHANASDELHVIKTHEPPLSNDPAIYVLRDGRSSIVSFFHYIAATSNPLPMEQIIGEMEHFGSWSSHFDAWHPLDRPHTLFLRFEDVTSDPAGTIARIAAFLGRPVSGEFALSFDELNKKAPQFFRSGSDKRNIEEMGPFMGPFSLKHGQLMAQMGYMTRDAVAEEIAQYARVLEADTRTAEPDVTSVLQQLAIIETNAHQRYANLYGLLDGLIKDSSRAREVGAKLEASEQRLAAMEADFLELKRGYSRMRQLGG